MKDAILNFLKSVDWKPLLYGFYTNTIKAELEKLVADTENKWDDAAVKAVTILVTTFLKPKAGA